MEGSSTNGSGGVNGSNGMSRAARFEDEKRRIIESCFGKKEDDGSLAESYITHIRIIEDAAYPSSPPPPNSSQDTKKPRLVIVAVRRSGRVRMHKARENGNGSFSIGKTWALDDLTGIKSFSSAVSATMTEEQQKQWAGGVGFVVSLGKPYYWQANTAKEKQFFIASLVKIFTKYTGGKSPELIGFEPSEREQLLGVSAAARPPPPSLQPGGGAARPSYGQAQNRPPRREPSQEPILRKQPSRDAVQRPPPPLLPPPSGTSSFTSQTSRPPSRPSSRPRPETSPNGSIEGGVPAIPRNQQNQQNQPVLKRIAGTNGGQESFGRSEENLGLPPRSRGGLNGAPNGPGRFQDRSMTPNSLRSVTPESSISSNKDTLGDVPPVPAPLALPPERRRPPIPNITSSSRQRGPNLDDNMIPSPLVSPGMRRDDTRPPVRDEMRLPSRDEMRPPTRDRMQPPARDEMRPPTRDKMPIPARDEIRPPVREGMRPPARSIERIPPPDRIQTPERTQPDRIQIPERNTNQIKTSPTRDHPDMTDRTASIKSSASIPSASPIESAIEPPPPAPPPVAIPVPEEPPAEEARPGLGPMIKKKSKGDIANSFFKAAKTANALNSFKPRAGGAAERLREMQAKTSTEGPDGITGVVPAPSLVRSMSGDVPTVPTPLPTPSTPQAPVVAVPVEKLSPRKPADSIPEVKITVPQAHRPSSVEGPIQAVKENTSIDKSKIREPRRPKPPSETMQKELASLGIDPSILTGRGSELVDLWEQFGWVGEGIRTKNVDQMQDEIERELNKAQAGGWMSRIDDEDERVAAVMKGLDKTIEECDELDGLLTLYNVELSTLNEDIAYIEAQGQGLQVQAANQKLLYAELKSLLDTIAISSEQLGSLREASLETPRGLEQVETSLVTLYKAMLTIDPSLSLSGPRPSVDGSAVSGKQGGYGNSEIGSMRVLQEKKDVYGNEITIFLRRLKPFLQVKFAAAVDETRKALEREKGNNLTRAAGKAKLDPRNHDLSRNMLWKYSPLMLFSREVDRLEWEDLIKTYEMICRPLYQDEFRDVVFAWKRVGRKPSGDEGDILFTSQIEKQTEGIATTARKLTVKRSQTLAKSLRSPIGDSNAKTSLDRSSDGRLQPYEVFAGVLDEMIPTMSMEQNFVVEFFHVTSLEQHDFPDAVAAAPPDRRLGGDLRRPRVMDPNRDLARLVVQSMEEVFAFFPADMQALVDWTIQADPLQGVGVIAAIERKLVEFEESNQEYLARTFQKIHTRLLGLFNKFVDEQIRAIEDTKVKIKKRKGVIAFIRIFPSFSLSLETLLISANDLEIRDTVNRAYARINRTMFESLKVIARENPSAQTAGADPEDKEALNYQILLIENMNHYLEEVDARNNPVLEDWKQNAAQEMHEHMSLYLGAVIRRPLGKLLDFLESTESLMLSRQPGEPMSQISGMPSHSKSTFKKILAGYDSKEIRRGIETLKKRVEKHFGDADDPGLSRNLVAKVIQNCEQYYEKVGDRILTISRDVYDGDVIAEWTKGDVSAAFRK
ncbi:Exocyst complex component [Lachnellula subtilissima]|uniref:Exocyst complex component n=1 Tax=Lachnellula subtilissima TaxID=602034 RepID=A0A8H8RMA2_9HELO|nr:Exocyst complex component [Lachnellula subtilissima]